MTYMPGQRVVVTGCGAMAPNGLGTPAFWSSLLDGTSGVGPITHFDTTHFRSKIAGEVTGFNLLDFYQPKAKVSRIARHTQLALAATHEAMQSANVDPSREMFRSTPIPLVVGVSSSAMDIIEEGQNKLQKYGPHRVPAYSIHSSVPQQTAGLISTELGIGSETHVVSSACASGLDAIAMACSLIQQNKADIAVAGGTDASLNSLPFSCIDRAGLASRRNAAPEQASRPFDRDADSGVISEGAGMLVLENAETAAARGAVPLCEITGTDIS